MPWLAAPARGDMVLLNALKPFCAWVINPGEQGCFSPIRPLLCLTPCGLQLGRHALSENYTTDRSSKSPVSRSTYIKIYGFLLVLNPPLTTPATPDVVILSLAYHWSDLTALFNV